MSGRFTLNTSARRRFDSTVTGIAGPVGYGTAFALSVAYRRERGISPQEHRALAGNSSSDRATVGSMADESFAGCVSWNGA